MPNPYVVTLKWTYPFCEAIGAKQVEVPLQAPTTVRLLLNEMVRHYPALRPMLEQNDEGEFMVFVLAEKSMLAMHHQVAESCTLLIVPLAFGG